MIYLFVGVALISLLILFFLRIINSENFVKSYCLTLFKKRQAIILKSFNEELRPQNSQSEEESQKEMIEMLQDKLWSKAKEFDQGISEGKFYLDLVTDIAYIVWLIYCINRAYDGSKS
jgi:hypothetical protein